MDPRFARFLSQVEELDRSSAPLPDHDAQGGWPQYRPLDERDYSSEELHEDWRR